MKMPKKDWKMYVVNLAMAVVPVIHRIIQAGAVQEKSGLKGHFLVFRPETAENVIQRLFQVPCLQGSMTNG